MPKLQDLRQVKEISLPSYPDSKVEIYDSLLVKELKSIDYNGENTLQALIAMLPKIIKSWNFVGDDDQPLPVTSDSLGLLKQIDLQFLLDEINNFNAEIKKKQGV